MKEAITVTQLNRYIKDIFYEDNILQNVLVKGEVSNFKEVRGNYYFALKDDSSVIQCVVFSNYASLDIDSIKDGLTVTVSGKVAVYEKNGTYSIYVNKIEQTGLGEYFIKLEELKKKLNDLGMFDKMYKKQVPTYSMNIGVVTAKDGAAIEDIYRTIKNKNPYASVILYPSKVQGSDAYQSIVKGIMELDKMNLDVIIIGRGGGSIEDLYCFNDERVAYAIFNANTPIISAVGHEINDSISDLVADVRVATPTAAGEMATFDYIEFLDELDGYKEALKELTERKVSDIREKLETLKEHLDLLAPKAKIFRYKERLEFDKELIKQRFYIKLNSVKNEVAQYIEKLKARDLIDKISKGLTYTTKENGKKIKSIKDVKKKDIIFSRVRDGVIKSEVL